MPAKNSRKTYVENGYYHLYNRGVEKRDIFLDPQDFSVFLNYLKEYLLAKDEAELRRRLGENDTSWREKEKILSLLRLNNFNGKIYLLCYSLMPNHLHLLVKQKEENTIDLFFNSLMTRYVGYFNRKYNRVGPLFQGVYKAVIVRSEPQLIHLSSYIHRNPISLGTKSLEYQKSYTSLPEYLGMRQTEWIKANEILNLFSKQQQEYSSNSYYDFISREKDLDLIKEIVIDADGL